jgi:phosphoribosylglycinamide formyltransferase-1
LPIVPTFNLGILVSGRGSNMLAIIRAIERGKIKGAKVRVVISDRREAKALESARKHGIDAVWLDPAKAATRLDYDRGLSATLREKGVTPSSGLVVLAGFMRLLSPEFVDSFRGRIMNIHPSLLPSFQGLRAQRQALEHGAKVSGCTVHFVVPEVDSGPIILQSPVKVKEGDTEESLSERILKEEHRIYPIAVKLFVEGSLKIKGRKVAILKK